MNHQIGLTKAGNQAKLLKYSWGGGMYFAAICYMFKCVAPNLDTQRTTTQQRLTCAQKCQVAAPSTIQAIRSSSESTGDV